MDINISSNRFKSLTNEERNGLYNLRDDPSNIKKGADKGSRLFISEREDYLKEAHN